MRQLHDAYFRKAKREGYFARSAYKLEELNRKHRLFGPGDAVLDLGSSPGSWIQVIRACVGDSGRVAGVDLQPVKPSILKLATVLCKPVEECAPEDFGPAGTRFDAVVSDMAPKTTGIRVTDQARSLELCETAWALAGRMLKPGGAFVCKIFESPETRLFVQQLRARFRAVAVTKPQASRSESFETFLVAKGFGQTPPEETGSADEAPNEKNAGRAASLPKQRNEKRAPAQRKKKR